MRADSAAWWAKLRRETWTVQVTAWLLVVVALLLLLRSFYRRELYHFTGDAAWMWVSDDVGEPRPTAGLFVFELELADHPVQALAKVCGDRQYVLWVNGQPAAAGHNRPGFVLDVVPVADLLKAGRNVLTVEARSPTSVGGVLFALDLTPSIAGRRAGDPRGRNVVVSGAGWRVLESWGAGPGEADPGAGRRPWLWGRPPDHPWSYPATAVHPRPLVQSFGSEPKVITAGDFARVEPREWLATLKTPVSGYLWITPARVDRPVSVSVSEAGRPRGDGVEVVALPGQDRWLYPGSVEGNEICIRGAAKPPRVEVVDGIATFATDG